MKKHAVYLVEDVEQDLIIYQVIGSDIFVHCVLDGRRDIQDMLQQRLSRWRPISP